MEMSIEERDLGDMDSNPVQLGRLYNKSVWSKQYWDPEISAYFTNRLGQISMQIGESA